MIVQCLSQANNDGALSFELKTHQPMSVLIAAKLY